MAQMRNPWDDPWAGTDYQDDPYAYQDGGAGQPPPAENAPAANNPPAVQNDSDRRPGIAAAYQQYLGRSPAESDYLSWLGNANYESGIAGSPEAAAYAKGQAYNKTYDVPIGFVGEKVNDPNYHSPKYDWLRATQDAPGTDLASITNYYNTKYGGNAQVTGKDSVDFGTGVGNKDVYFDVEGEHRPQWNDVGGPVAGSGGGGGGGGYTPPVLPTVNPANMGGYKPGAGGVAPGGVSYPTSFGGINGASNDFTTLLTNAYGDIIKGGGPNASFNNDIQQGFKDFFDPKVAQGRLTDRVQTARETMERGRKTQLKNYQGILADRNIIGEPGIAQGPEISSYAGLENDIAPVYAQALREALATGDEQTLAALQSAGAFNNQAQANYQNTISAAGNYQGMLTNLALQQLGQNIQWQQFLAQYGLDATRLQNEIESGHIDDLMKQFELYLQEAQIRANGQVA